MSRNDEIVRAFMRGETTGRAHALTILALPDGSTALLSYDEPIAIHSRDAEAPDVYVIKHDYSPTTNKHIGAVLSSVHTGWGWKQEPGPDAVYPALEPTRIDRATIRRMAGYPDTPARVRRDKRHTIATDPAGGYVVRMGERID